MDDTRPDPDCELCEAARLTPWFHEDELCWVAECEACAVLMVVWRPHRTDPSPADEASMLDRLPAVADAQRGEHWIAHDRRARQGGRRGGEEGVRKSGTRGRAEH